MPGYRFGGLVMAHLVENRSDEGLEKLNNSLSQSDLTAHPFLDTVLQDLIKAIITIRHGIDRRASGYVPALETDSDVPIETQKRREAEAAGKPFIVPDWWRGEDANYKVAQVMMKTVPKDIGPLKN